MSTTTLTRLSGLALIAAFALTLTGGILHPVIGGDSHAAPSLTQPLFSTAHLLIFLGEICLLFGLPGLYARIAPRTGLLGLFGGSLVDRSNGAALDPLRRRSPLLLGSLVVVVEATSS